MTTPHRMPARPLDALRFVLLTGLGTGLAPVVPGTVGTLPGVVLGILACHLLTGPALLTVVFGLAGVLLVFGMTQTAFLERRFGHHDPQAVVLDEVVGYLIALGIFLVVHGAPEAPWVVGLFVSFRAFDILKPPPVGRLEDLPGAVGVMADDAMAGLLAGGLAAVLAVFLG